VLRRLIKRGFPSTLALDDGAAAHFVGTRLKEVVASRRRARAMKVALSKGSVVETPIRVRYLGTGLVFWTNDHTGRFKR
jgi:dipeptidase E